MIITEQERKEILEKYGLSSGNNLKSGYFMYFAFPNYRATLENNWFTRFLAMHGRTIEWFEDKIDSLKNKIFSEQERKKIEIYKTGHGGCIIVDKLGNVKMFEFGPYDKEGDGEVHEENLGKIAQFDKNSNLMNASEIAKIAKSKTFGSGPRLQMIVSLLVLPNVQAALGEANRPRTYSLIDILGGGSANCGTFAIEVARKGGIRDVEIGYTPEKPATIYKTFNQSRYEISSFKA